MEGNKLIRSEYEISDSPTASFGCDKAAGFEYSHIATQPLSDEVRFNAKDICWTKCQLAKLFLGCSSGLVKRPTEAYSLVNFLSTIIILEFEYICIMQTYF